MRVRVLFFGKLKEITGIPDEAVELRFGAAISELFEHCAAKQPELAKYRSSVVASRNEEFAAWTTVLEAGDEVAFLPPVSGG